MIKGNIAKLSQVDRRIIIKLGGKYRKVQLTDYTISGYHYSQSVTVYDILLEYGV
jgi:hypothetical protein